MTKPSNPPAFPVKVTRNTSTDPLATPREMQMEGMTLRDWFAGQALAGLLANPVSFGPIMQGDPEAISSACGTFADAMLSERERGQ